MWEIKVFKTKEAKNKWILNNQSKYQIEEVFINNGYGLDVRKLKKL